MVFQTEPDGKVRFLGYLLGRLSVDNHTFILYRKTKQRVIKHDAYGMSRCLAVALQQKGCKMLIIAIDGINKYKISMEKFINEGIHDRLWKQQAMHIFMPIKKLETISRI